MLDDIVNKYNKTVHRTIKMKPIGVKDNTYIDSAELHSKKEVNNKGPKFKVGDHVRISRYRNGEEIIGTFYEKELQKSNQKEFRIEKVIKRRGDKWL